MNRSELWRVQLPISSSHRSAVWCAFGRSAAFVDSAPVPQVRNGCHLSAARPRA